MNLRAEEEETKGLKGFIPNFLFLFTPAAGRFPENGKSRAECEKEEYPPSCNYSLQVRGIRNGRQGKVSSRGMDHIYSFLFLLPLF